MEREWLERATAQVLNLVSKIPSDSENDIYVWSDGSVTGPKSSESRVENLRVISVFSPNESLTETQVRESLRNGLREAEQARADKIEATGTP